MRYCAVNGAVTVLREAITSALLEDLEGGGCCCRAVTTAAGQVLECGHLVGNSKMMR